MSGIQCSFQRCEKKYFLTPAQQQALLAVMADHTRRDVYGEYTICNTYYDTEDWRLIRASIEKPAYKEKLRMRSYGTPSESSKVFAELKKKCGGVVYKRRITTSPARAEALLARRLPGACPLWLSHALSDIGAYPVSFSKYGYCYKEYILPTLQNNKKEAQHCA